MKTIVVTGAAGLVGQNLIPRLKARGYAVIGIDKHPTNTQRLRELHPDIMVIEEDLSEAGPWMDAFAGANAVVITSVPPYSTAVGVPARVVTLRGRRTLSSDELDHVHLPDPILRRLEHLERELARHSGAYAPRVKRRRS